MSKVIDDVLASRRGGRGGRSETISGQGRGKRSPIKTVVKGRYRTLAKGGTNPARGRASGVMRNLDYMTTRPDHEHQHRISRDIITPEGRINVQEHPELRRTLEEELTQAKEKYIYHLVLSSGDQTMSPKDVELWSKAVLQGQGIDKYYLVVHAGDQGHTKNPHAHVIVRSDVRFGREDFFNMRKSGDVERQFHRQLFRGIEEAWKERVADKTTSSGGGVRETEREEEERGKRRTVDLQFE